MDRKNIFGWIIVFIATISILLMAAHRQIQAQSEGSDSSVSAKLDEVLAVQKSISEKLDSIKGELQIIKMRITQQQ